MDQMTGFEANRRDWLRWTLGGLAALGGGLARPWIVGTGALASQDLQRLQVLQDDPLNAETPASIFEEFLTPNDLFFVRNHLEPPPPERLEGWRLTVSGLVDRRLNLGLEDLEGFEPVTLTAVLQCSGNGRAFHEPAVGGVPWVRGAVGNAEWSGVRLRDLLERAGVADESQHIHLHGSDLPTNQEPYRFIRSIPIERAMDADTMIATRMNGEPLPYQHGGPLRLVVPNWFGNHWLKWLERVVPARDEAPGHYMEDAYRVPPEPVEPGAPIDPAAMVPVTIMPVKSLIAMPITGARLPAGRGEIVGVAWSGSGPIDQVEVALGAPDAWQPATLFGPDRPHAWRLWRIFWKAPPGRHVLRCRATDTAGNVQPEATPWNPKGYLWNANDRVEVEVIAKG
ncbi:sulfite oxidase [soil metagenome]